MSVSFRSSGWQDELLCLLNRRLKVGITGGVLAPLESEGGAVWVLLLPSSISALPITLPLVLRQACRLSSFLQFLCRPSVRVSYLSLTFPSFLLLVLGLVLTTWGIFTYSCSLYFFLTGTTSLFFPFTSPSLLIPSLCLICPSSDLPQWLFSGYSSCSLYVLSLACTAFIHSCFLSSPLFSRPGAEYPHLLPLSFLPSPCLPQLTWTS